MALHAQAVRELRRGQRNLRRLLQQEVVEVALERLLEQRGDLRRVDAEVEGRVEQRLLRWSVDENVEFSGNS